MVKNQASCTSRYNQNITNPYAEGKNNQDTLCYIIKDTAIKKGHKTIWNIRVRVIVNKNQPKSIPLVTVSDSI